MSWIEVDDIGDAVQVLDQRLYDVEQTLTSPEVMTGPLTNEFPTGIVLGPDETVVQTGVIPPPTNLTGIAGDFFDNLYVDLDWDAPVGVNSDQVVQYDVEIAKKVTGVYQLAQVRTGGSTSMRIERLEPNTTYGFRVFAVDRVGKRSVALGWVDVAVGVDSTIPAAVTGVVLTAGFKTIIVTWNDLVGVDTGEGKGTYRVQVADNSGFSSGLETKVVNASLASFGPYNTAVTKFARVQAVDSSGNDGPYVNSTPTSVTTVSAQTADIANLAITTAKIADLAVDSAKVANAAIVTAKIGDLQVTNAKVADLNVNKLTSGSITTANLTISGSGSIIVGTPPGGTGLLINSQGLRLYAGGVQTVILDAATGAGTFNGTISGGSIDIGGADATSFHVNTSGDMWLGHASFASAPFKVSNAGSLTVTGGTITGGTIRTASSGARVQMASANGDRIEWWTGNGSETKAGWVEGFNADFGSGNQPVLSISSGQYGSTGSAITLRGRPSGGAALAKITYSGTHHEFSGGTITNSSGIHISVASGPNDTHSGVWGGLGGAVRARGGGNAMSWGWNAGTYEMVVDSTLVKTFVIDHPTKSDHHLIHATVEGPENAVFYRGRSRLQDGSCWVKLPDYFEALTEIGGRTVQLTPIIQQRHFDAMHFNAALSAIQSKNQTQTPVQAGVPYLAATDVVDGYFCVVQAGGFVCSDAEFFWEVKAVRKDVEPLLIEPHKKDVVVTGDGPYRYYRRK